MNWIKKHKFWTSTIILFILAIVLSGSSIEAYFYGSYLGIYIFVGVIIKTILYYSHRRKKTTGEVK